MAKTHTAASPAKTTDLPSWGPVAEYMTDAIQRTVLYWDVMRQRSDQYYAEKAKDVPHVLRFDAEVVLDARTFEKPVNYLLARIHPPAGMTVEWEAELIQEKECDWIAWRSLAGSQIENSGSVRFEPAPGGRGTELRVDLQYDPPAGFFGASIAKLFGKEPSEQIEGDLRRFKQVMETGEVINSDASIHRGMHAAQPPEEVPDRVRARLLEVKGEQR